MLLQVVARLKLDMTFELPPLEADQLTGRKEAGPKEVTQSIGRFTKSPGKVSVLCGLQVFRGKPVLLGCAVHIPISLLYTQSLCASGVVLL